MHGSFRISLGALAIDLARREARWAGRRVRLLHREFDVLVHLAMRAPAIVTRRELLREICGLTIDPGTNVIEVHISRLRTRLRTAGAPPLVETVRGEGYRMRGPS